MKFTTVNTLIPLLPELISLTGQELISKVILVGVDDEDQIIAVAVAKDSSSASVGSFMGADFTHLIVVGWFHPATEQVATNIRELLNPARSMSVCRVDDQGLAGLSYRAARSGDHLVMAGAVWSEPDPSVRVVL